MNETMTITTDQYDEFKAMADAVHYISGILDLEATDKVNMKIKLDLIVKKIEPFAIKRVKETADVLGSYKEVANG